MHNNDAPVKRFFKKNLSSISRQWAIVSFYAKMNRPLNLSPSRWGREKNFPLTYWDQRIIFSWLLSPLSRKIAKTKSLLPSLCKREEFPSLEKRDQGRFCGSMSGKIGTL
jgi:hypothetical protein